jgi:23S rRNA pseudouridine1911/1915/1917 synthase
MRLDAQLRTHKLERRYYALVWGHVAESAGRGEGAIGLTAGHPVAREVSEAGQQAATRYEVLARYDTPAPEGSSLLMLKLETGRTHQIRVHMAHLGHPLLGDDLYAPDRPAAIARQALHAATLAFEHPRTGAWCRFEAPLPPDMEALAPGFGPER